MKARNSFNDLMDRHVESDNANESRPIKQARRNIDALGESDKPMFEKSRKKENRYVPRELSGLEYDISQVKEVEKTININDSESFPTLNKATTDIKKVSVWNVFNPILTEQNDKPIQIKSGPIVIEKSVQKFVENKTTINNSYVYNSDEEIHTSGDEYYEEEEDDYYEQEEDSEITYMREKYYKRDELLYNIQIVKEKFNKRNIDHVTFLNKLERDLATIEDEIYRYEELENEMERIYGPFYNNPSSLLDDYKRKQEEKEAAEINPQKFAEFIKILNSVK
jgi:hypothetical protein